MPQTKRPGRRLQRATPWAVGIVLLAAALAGCMHPDDDESGDPGGPGDGGFPPGSGDPGPSNRLSAEFAAMADTEGWAETDNFTFDASDFTVTNGNVSRWTFDLGDGTNVTVMPPDAPIVNHTYESGGVYSVTITLHAEGGADGNETTTATESVVVVVHDRHDIPAGALESTFLIGEGDSHLDTFAAGANATSFTVVIDITAADGLFGADGTVRVSDPADEEVGSETFELDGGANTTVRLEGEIAANGTYTVTVELASGEIEFSGYAEVRYAAPDEDEDSSPPGEGEE